MYLEPVLPWYQSIDGWCIVFSIVLSFFILVNAALKPGVAKYSDFTIKAVIVYCAMVVTIVFKELLLVYILTPPDHFFPTLYNLSEESRLNTINSTHWSIAKNHPYHFNDKINDYEAITPLSSVVAVVGDSFIWGWGIEEQHRWNSRLATISQEKGMPITVFHWGYPGWGIEEELEFLVQQQYSFKNLTVLWALNESDLSPSPSWIHDLHAILTPLARFVPRLADLLQRALGKMYRAYILPYLHSSTALRATLHNGLTEFVSLCARAEWHCAVILTPGSIDSHTDQIFTIFEDQLKLHRDLPYLNLLPLTQKKFAYISPAQLQVSPIDAHPGALLTAFYAEKVFEFLNERRVEKR
jgi:hypothetical protein